MTAQEKLEDLLRQQKELDEKVREIGKSFLSDKSISLEDRWAFFIKSDIGEVETFICHFEALKDFSYNSPTDNALEDTWLRNDYRDRHETIDIEYVLEYMGDKLGDEIEVFTKRHPKESHFVKLTQDHINALMEECLERNLKGFVLDW